MLNKTSLKFSLGFAAVIMASFIALVAIGYYKIENPDYSATPSEELKILPQQ